MGEPRVKRASVVGVARAKLHPVATVGEPSSDNPDAHDYVRLGHLRVAGSGLEHV